MLHAVYIHMMLILALVIVCLTSNIVSSTPQCAQNFAKKEDIICINVKHINDLRGVAQNDWNHLKIVNKELKQLEWGGEQIIIILLLKITSIGLFLELPEEFQNLEILDISKVGELVLDENGFNSFSNLKSLNVSGCKLKSLKGTHFNDLNQLKNLDASWNSLEIISSDLKQKFQSLEVANFSHNGIQSIDTDGIMSKLRVLHLDFNELKSIILHNFPNLNILTISDNVIEKVSKFFNKFQ